MNILHISNGFADSKVHSNLTQKIDDKGHSQTVYCPVRSKSDLGKYQYEGKHIKFVYSYCIKPWYKYVYHYKANKLYADMKSKIDISKFDIIHAPTFFSDGAQAYKAFKEYGIPYVVAVRTTDISVFIERKLYHTWPLGKKILRNASRIYFVSTAGMNWLKSTSFGKSIWPEIENKCEVRPNGIEDVWIENINPGRTLSHKICYVGTFLRRKNIKRVAEAVAMLRLHSGYEDLTFRIIGGGKDRDDEIKSLIESHTDYIEYLGKIYDKAKLMEAMRECTLFAMPSVRETFGLVYVEALSQGLPVVYTKNDGIDGFFDESVGIAVDPSSVDDIYNALKSLIDNPQKYNNHSVDFEKFNWDSIANRYLNDYKTIINE